MTLRPAAAGLGVWGRLQLGGLQRDHGVRRVRARAARRRARLAQGCRPVLSTENDSDGSKATMIVFE